MSNIIITRKELYNLVWSTPMIKLAKKYAITDYGLRKICVSMNIPLPKPGHWEKERVGKKVEIEPLTENYSGVEEVTLALYEEGGQLVKASRKKVSEDIINPIFIVPEKLSNPDKMVTEARKSLTSKRKYELRNGLAFTNSGELSINAAPENVGRALRFMDAFIKVMQSRGYQILIENETQAVIGEEKFSICLRELCKRITIKDTYERTDHVPTGKLSFIATFHYRSQVIFKDGRHPIEEQLENIIFKLELKAEETRVDRLKTEKRLAEQREEERLRKEAENRKANELSEFKKLLLKSKRWKEAVDLRAYLDTYESNLIQKGNLSDEKIKWLEWARKKADWYDPEIELEDELLNGIDRNEINKQKPNTPIYNWSNY